MLRESPRLKDRKGKARETTNSQFLRRAFYSRRIVSKDSPRSNRRDLLSIHTLHSLPINLKRSYLLNRWKEIFFGMSNGPAYIRRIDDGRHACAARSNRKSSNVTLFFKLPLLQTPSVPIERVCVSFHLVVLSFFFRISLVLGKRERGGYGFQ